MKKKPKKRLPKAEYERKKSIQIAEKSKPDKHYDGVELNINNERFSYDPCDPLTAAVYMNTILSIKRAKRANKMWGPVVKK